MAFSDCLGSIIQDTVCTWWFLVEARFAAVRKPLRESNYWEPLESMEPFEIFRTIKPFKTIGNHQNYWKLSGRHQVYLSRDAQVMNVKR